MGGAYPHGFLQGLFPNTHSTEPLFHFTHFWSSNSVKHWEQIRFLTQRRLYSTIRWEPCNRWRRATASAFLFSSQTFLRDSSANQSQAQCLHSTITFGLYYIQADFWSSSTQRIMRAEHLIYSFFCHGVLTSTFQQLVVQMCTQRQSIWRFWFVWRCFFGIQHKWKIWKKWLMIYINKLVSHAGQCRIPDYNNGNRCYSLLFHWKLPFWLCQ